MPQLERYMLSKLMGLFGFFALVLVSIYWVNRAVLLFDQLIGDGQTAWVVLQFTLLTLPNVIRLVLPVAAFAATIYAITRLASDSELVVMQAAGASPWRLARPVIVFGVIVALMMSALTHVLVPLSRAALGEQQAEISENISARFLNEGSFQHPADGITIYIREITELGELRDMFLSDERNPAQQMIYTADKALIVRSDTGPKLVMFDGMVQTLRTADNNLAITRFADFTYNIGALIGPSGADRVSLEDMPSWDLINPSAELLASANATPAQVWSILNERFSQPLRAPALAIIGFAALMLGGYSRFGMGRQVGLAVGCLIALQFLSNLMDSMMRGKPELWALAYVPMLAGFAGAALLLAFAGRRRRTRGGAQ